MKEGWEYKKLGDVCSFMSGYTPKKEELNNKSGVPYFKVSDMNRDENGYEMNRTELFVKRPKKIFPVGAIIFPKNGGAIFTEKKRFLVCDSIIDLNTEAILSNESFLKKEYLFYLLTKIKISTFDNGGGLPSVNIKKMCDYEICIPPLPEQQSIVDYLDSAFAKIDAMKANAEKALNEAKALFQASLKEMLEPKEGWEEKTIGEVSLLKSGNSDANKSKPGSLPYVKVGDMNLKGNETYITVSSTYVDRQDNIKNIFPIGTLIFPKRGGAIFTNKKRLTEIEICCDLNVMGVIPNKNSVLPLFLYYFFNTIDFNIFKDEGASIPQINNKNIAPIMICLPSLSEQQSIVATLDSLKSKVDRLQANYDKISQECDALKQAILRQVFE